MRSITIFPISMIVFAFSGGTLVASDYSTQTDWSGGSGVLGPVTDWTNTFDQYSDTRWMSEGRLSLPFMIIEHIVSDNTAASSKVHLVDIDGDGDTDVVSSDSDNGGSLVWYKNNDGAGTNWTQQTIEGSVAGAVLIQSADLDSDGDMDVICPLWNGNVISWWENEDGAGSSWSSHAITGYFEDPRGVTIGDIDADNDPDIIGTAYDGNQVACWENDSLGQSWTQHMIDDDFAAAFTVGHGYIDCDTDIDVVAGGGSSIAWYDNSDTAPGVVWFKHTVDGTFTSPHSVLVSDIDGDGDGDIVGAAYIDDEVCWWENTDGSGVNWSEHVIDADFNGPRSVRACDVDSDGDMDVVGGASSGEEICWWENLDGSGTSWAENIVKTSFWAASTDVADIDGDNYLDVISVSWVEYDVFWWTLAGVHQITGELTSSILDTEADPQWALIDWTEEVTADADINFEYRTSNDPGSMGSWLGPLNEPCSLSGSIERYFQYKVHLETTDSTVTPFLNDITLSWDPTGVVGHSALTTSLIGARCNPSHETTSIEFTLNESMMVELIVLDLSGRMVCEIRDEYPSGMNEVEVSDLRTGVYFVRMISGDFHGTERFVLIE